MKMAKKASKSKNLLHHAIHNFEKTTKKPTDYLTEKKETTNTNLMMLKSLFDYAKTSGTHFQSKCLPEELFIEQMDEEQIWQQLEMQNDSFWEKCMSETCRLLSLNEIKLALKIDYPGQELKMSSNQESDNRSGQSIGHASDDSYRKTSESDPDSDSDVENSQNEAKLIVESDKEENSIDQLGRNKSNNGGTCVLDDNFFKLSEMEAFLDNEDKKELNRLNGRNIEHDSENESDEIDYFESLSDNESSEEEAEQDAKNKDIMFADFFDTDNNTEQLKHKRKADREAKNKRKEMQMKQDLGMEDSEAECIGSEGQFERDDSYDKEKDEIEKSEFDVRQERLKKRIEELEENALADKSWQLKGEITSATRPKNSLLEEVLDFDSVARPAPLITEETTMCLEDIIKRRIKSKAWDDVERKIKPINSHQDFRKNLVLQQEKSKESLAQIYEKEYLEKVHKQNTIDDSTKPDEPAEHADIRKALEDLFVKLDALSNFHFTSKPVASEAKIITNIPAIEMEEVAPVAVSDATLLAPEEVRSRPVGDEIGKTERTITDKKRERRKKKQKQKLIKNQNDKRVEEKERLGLKVTSKEKQQQLMNQVTKSRNVIKGKNTTNTDEKTYKSSKSFFTQLQDNTSSGNSKGTNKKRPKTDLSKHESNAKRLKL